ncbi:MAG: cyanophycin synthetase, partial [bacterium]|nr:cyanophycin synthetase [bacterium]
QKEGDVLIVGKDLISKDLDPFRTRRVLNGSMPIPEDWKLNIAGAHNRENAALAATALKALGLSESEIKAGVESFEGVEGRLQFVRELNGVKIYNDNNATTPEATIAALHALHDVRLTKSNIVLIAGGADKGLDLNGLIIEIKSRCKTVILLAGSGTERIKKELPDAPVFDNLKDAFDAALKNAASGNIVLFSPAFASFGMFKNEYDRNDQFLALVRAK